jgi:hypothetical protein
MKRFRLSTLLLLAIIAALVVALVVQHDRAARREVELQLEFAINLWSAKSIQRKINREAGGGPARQKQETRNIVERISIGMSTCMLDCSAPHGRDYPRKGH